MAATTTQRKKVTTPYFPNGLRYITPALLLAGIYLTIIHPVWGIILILLAVIIFTTHYATEIDLHQKTYSDYVSFLWMPFGKEAGKFTQLEKIVITKGNYAQTVNTRVQSRTFEFSDYTGTLIFIGNHTLDLLTDIDKKRLLKRLKAFSQFLKIGVEDRTTHSPYWIDIDKY